MTSEWGTVVLASLDEIELDTWPMPSAESGIEIDGAPTLKGAILWRSDDGKRLVGVERCTPCTIRGTHVDEFDYLLAGKVTLRLPNETPAEREMKAGDVLFLREGTQSEWVIHETMLKVFHLRSDNPIKF